MGVALTVLRLRETGQLVFQRRDHRTRVYPGLLTFFGGSIEPGESPVEAARREVNEETSVDLPGTDALRELGSRVVDLPLTGPTTVHLFEAVIDSADLAVYEGAGAETYSRAEALRLDDLADHARRLLADLVD